MKKILIAFLVVAGAVAAGMPRAQAAAHVEVSLAPMGASFAPPSLGRNQGWLTITNRDWKPYTVTIARKGRMAIAEGALPMGTVIRSGSSVTFAVEKATWELLGSSGDDLKVRVREGRTSTVSLEPFGYANNTGLRGISNDGERVRDEVLFESYAVVAAPPVIVQHPPVIVQQPPVVVQHPPVIVQQPPVIVVRPGRRPTHRPPAYRSNRDRDGFSFSFGFSSR